MTRLVVPKRSGEATHRGPGPRGHEGDAYKDRVAKYIPAEVVGGYVSLDSLVNSKTSNAAQSVSSDAVTRTPDASAATDAAVAQPEGIGALFSAIFLSLPGIVFLACLLLAPLYVWHLARRAGITAWKMQAAIAMLAFVVWAYAIKGTVFFKNTALDSWAAANLGRAEFYDPTTGALLLILFSLIVGLYQPKER